MYSGNSLLIHVFMVMHNLGIHGLYEYQRKAIAMVDMKASNKVGALIHVFW